MLQSNRKKRAIILAAISVASPIFIMVVKSFENGPKIAHPLQLLIGLPVLLFVVVGIPILSIDITADSNYIYITKNFIKKKIEYSEIKMAEFYKPSSAKGPFGLAIRIIKNDGRVVTQDLAILDKKNVDVLKKTLASHHIPTTGKKIY